MQLKKKFINEVVFQEDKGVDNGTRTFNLIPHSNTYKRSDYLHLFAYSSLTMETHAHKCTHTLHVLNKISSFFFFFLFFIRNKRYIDNEKVQENNEGFSPQKTKN